nr:unnamed protein product [Spirometra erinaceieuropaei]
MEVAIPSMFAVVSKPPELSGKAETQKNSQQNPRQLFTIKTSGPSSCRRLKRHQLSLDGSATDLGISEPLKNAFEVLIGRQ